MTSPTTASRQLFGANHVLLKRDQIVAIKLLERFRRPVGRPAVGMEPEDQPLGDDVGDEVGILVAHLEALQHLLLLAIELFVGERRVADDVGQQVEPGSRLSFITIALT